MVAGTQVIAISESLKVKKILNSVAIILFIGAVVAFGIFYSIAKEVKIKPGEEKIISANEYMQKAEVELTEVKKYTEENNVVEIQRHAAKALEYAILATDLEPSNPEIWFRRGNLYWEIKNISVGADEWALKSYERALELDPGNPIYRQKVEDLIKDEVASWQIYRNDEYGFEFKYPKDWSTIEDTSPQHPYLVFVTLGLKETIQQGGLFGVILRDQSEDEFFSLLAQEKFYIISQSETTLGDKQATFYILGRTDSPGIEWEEVITQKDSFLLEFSKGATPGYDDIFNQILSTFRFLE